MDVPDDLRSRTAIFVGVGVLDDPRVELTEYGKIADKYIKQLNDHYENVSVEQYVIMPNHITYDFVCSAVRVVEDADPYE